MSEDLWSLPAPVDAERDAPRVVAGSVTLIVPTFNEAGNIVELLRRLGRALPGDLPCAVLFVDDSTDDTPAVIEKAAADHAFPVSVLHREAPEGGLGGAVVAGIARADTDWIVVMDADLQHPPHLVPELVGEGERTGADLVVASRYTSGGSRAGLAGSYRVAVSRGATWLTKGLFPRALRGISDPMSGFFAMRRSAVTAQALQPLGYKILLELAVRCRPAAVAEVPFVFQERFAGESKSTAREGMRFLAHLASLRSAAPVARMIGFGLIGLTGFVPNLAALWLLTGAGMHYLPAEIVANQAGVLWNFVLIEVLLFRERRRHRHWADRVGRFALLANADLLLRIPLIAVFVGRLGLGVLPATALALVTTFVLRFAATEALVYLPRRRTSPPTSGRHTRS
ncbi:MULTISPECIES: glycosyltransferase [Streptomyces]|uniref:Dolichol monophosphate mannose synthase n=1 Tax=Streptomyces virginiae TaxID=1961 RepID=A0ABQ3NDI2_STRVG|nr:MULTISPECIES: glycosyltransferase [Streptomyces]MBP2346159.1 dolichol-phosphate mannosyltransferase [Streptomyces virginiae]MCI4083419.1 glycosyltransferase [Streptomyces sp. MMS21 TC-5]RST14310.1 glycosyltransferase [Streptomyces sp. WAC05950]GGQ21086.1 dolichol monophosphate mannose synthase [Streptomyces virginiae]GHI10845.1 dolichol monophosphate mannose synthase [Streptomyces virginiae]